MLKNANEYNEMINKLIAESEQQDIENAITWCDNVLAVEIEKEVARLSHSLDIEVPVGTIIRRVGDVLQKRGFEVNKSFCGDRFIHIHW